MDSSEVRVSGRTWRPTVRKWGPGWGHGSLRRLPEENLRESETFKFTFAQHKVKHWQQTCPTKECGQKACGAYRVETAQAVHPSKLLLLLRAVQDFSCSFSVCWDVKSRHLQAFQPLVTVSPHSTGAQWSHHRPGAAQVESSTHLHRDPSQFFCWRILLTLRWPAHLSPCRPCGHSHFPLVVDRHRTKRKIGGEGKEGPSIPIYHLGPRAQCSVRTS